ncbi:hypothetical protein FOT62_25270 [Serratia marcescens]|uniref:6-bladed beta-propeller n=1 Tax=Serratia marcescens TaxID=615 RepID=A0A5C7BD70_SERMA|nr:hypothetical protein [Serratia marcescens]TXE21971.1 hypothetical protein FOT62_25270 [Serratia marcescens]TXE58044.1 hypothetical protein FOT56_21890 [Serratia marcescens]
MTINLKLTLLTFSFFLFSCNGSVGNDNIPQVKSSVYNNEIGNLCWPTQLTKEGGRFIITDYKNNRFLIKDGTSWKSSSIGIHGAHSLAMDNNGNFVIDDTENNRIIITKHIDKPSNEEYIYSVNGKALNRPHAVEVSGNGYIYVIDSLRLIRISSDYKKIDELWFKAGDLGYARSLKIIDGILYVINSSSGNLIKITDFDKGDYKIISTSSHKINDGAGSYERTGPIINDVEKFNGWFYASNYFTSSWAKGTDAEKNKLIRWKTWDDFESGNFQDLSQLLPTGQLPYFMKNINGELLITTFNHENPCHNESALILE